MADIPVDDRLTARHYKAIAALISEMSIRKASESSGVPERTIYTWLRDPAFDAAYRQARRDAVAQATARLQQVSGAAVQVLVQLMAKDTVHPTVRLGAAKTVLELAIKAVELEDIAARLTALEAKYAEKL